MTALCQFGEPPRQSTAEKAQHRELQGLSHDGSPRPTRSRFLQYQLSPLSGGRVIDEPEAAVVRQIFHDFASGKSPRKIAFDLNHNEVAGPRSSGGGFAACDWTSLRDKIPNVLHGRLGTFECGCSANYVVLAIGPPDDLQPFRP